MATIKQTAKEYESSKIQNITDLEEIPLDLELKTGTEKDFAGNEFKYLYAEVKGKKYKVSERLLKDIKLELKKNPNLQIIGIIKYVKGTRKRYIKKEYQEEAKPQSQS